MELHRRILRATKRAGLITVLTSMLATAAAQTSLSASFVARRDFPVGQNPASVAAADFNSDGKLDLVTVNQASNDVSVLLGNGDGTFQPAVSYAVPETSGFVQVGDFNGDGKLDVLVASISTSAPTAAIASVSILLGNGDGTFQVQKLTTLANSNCRCFAVGDFNGDGKLDLVFPTAVPQLNNSALMLMLGNGDGTFQPPVIGNPGPFTTPTTLEAVDLNGHRKLGLVGYAGSLLIFLGNGDGTFPSPTSIPTNGGQPLVADVNGDGRADLVLCGPVNASFPTFISVFLGNGDGTFQPAVLTSSSYAITPIASMPVPGDFNGDGKLDLLIGKTVVLGNGDGTFALPGILANESDPSFAVAGDFNGDGRLDIATVVYPGYYGSTSSGLASVALGNGDGTFQFESSLNVGGEGIVAGDFTGNGNFDLLESLFPRDFTFALLVGNGKGTFVPTLLVGGVCPDGHQSFYNCPTATGDLNLDGRLDFVATSARIPAIGVSLGNGDGTFQPEVDYSGGGNSIALGDFNRDGVADIVTCCDSANNASILLGKGDGTFGFPATVPVGGSAQFVAVADFNGDGNPDLAVVTSSSVVILLGNGDGTFGAAVGFPTAAGSVSVAVGDFNGDGKLDLATSNFSSNSISVLLGNGDGTFGAATSIPIVNSPNSIVVGDFNGDGKADLAALIPGEYFSDVAVLVGNGDGTFQSPSYFGIASVPVDAQGLAVADLNGDGSLDIAIPGSVLFNRDTGPVAAFAPSLAAFGSTGVSFPATLTVTLINSGTKTLTITSITLTGLQRGDFGQTNNCNNSLAAGASCDFIITFTPSALGLRTASILVADNALNTPQVISLSGTGVTTAPKVSLTPGTLTFANQPTGTSSAPNAVTLTNTGDGPLTVSSIMITGSENSDFPESNTCTGSVAVGGKCTISVIFTPSLTGARSATLSVTDNASGSPQTVALSGTGASPGLGLVVAPGGSSSATVLAGNLASYTLSIGGQGIGGAASLSCTGAPKGANCSFPPNETVSATSTSTFTISVTTTSRTLATSNFATWRSRQWWAIIMIASLFLLRVDRRSRWITILPALALILLFCSCGGSDHGAQQNPNGTPVGSYTLNLTATSGATNQSVSLTLNVQ